MSRTHRMSLQTGSSRWGHCISTRTRSWSSKKVIRCSTWTRLRSTRRACNSAGDWSILLHLHRFTRSTCKSCDRAHLHQLLSLTTHFSGPSRFPLIYPTAAWFKSRLQCPISSRHSYYLVRLAIHYLHTRGWLCLAIWIRWQIQQHRRSSATILERCMLQLSIKLDAE